MAIQQELFSDGGSNDSTDSDNLRRHLKETLQGRNGFIGKIRDEIMPDSKHMAKLVQEKMENEGQSFSDPDRVIEKFIDCHYEIYKKHAESVGQSLSQFPLHKIVDEQIINKLGENYLRQTIGEILGESALQSRKSRAGLCLMDAISYTLEKSSLKFIQYQDFQREFVGVPNCCAKLDFFFPNMPVYNHDPEHCCIVACQTTSNDRVRLIGAQVGKIALRRGCTAIGSENFSQTLGIKSLTPRKLEEEKSMGIKIVVFNRVIDKPLRESGVVISYADWFEELSGLKKTWNN